MEIGGTVGDIESLPFLEAIRQMRVELGSENTLFIHLTLVPYIASAGEVKQSLLNTLLRNYGPLEFSLDILFVELRRRYPRQSGEKLHYLPM